MAMYYRWRKSAINCQDNSISLSVGATISKGNNFVYQSSSRPSIKQETGTYIFSDDNTRYIDNVTSLNQNYFAFSVSPTEMYRCESGTAAVGSSYHPGSDVTVERTPVNKYTIITSPGAEQGYVYSTSSSAYPNGGVQDGYYYDQRTTVTSPTVASNFTYPKSIGVTSSSSVQLQWTGAQSNTDYPVIEYEVSYAINNTDSWQVAGTTGVLTYEFSNIPEEATSIAFRVRAKDSNNQYGEYVTGTYSIIIRNPPITVTTRTIEMNYFNGTNYEILYPVVGSEVYNHVKSGNYIGSGQYGQSNPNKLELEFTPKVAMITKTSGVYDTYLLNGKTVSYVQSSSGVSEITVEWAGQTVSWYSADSVEAQLNENGVLYAYVVFG